MSNVENEVRDMDEQKPKYDLEERTAAFGELVIRFARRVSRYVITDPLVRQLIRAATSVGANYCEADDSGSGKEFYYRISLCKREARETMHWLRMMAAAAPELKTDARTCWQEAKELNLIFSAIYRRKPKDGQPVPIRHSSFDIRHSDNGIYLCSTVFNH